MTKLINQIGNPPINTEINQSTLKTDSTVLKNTDMVGKTNGTWNKWFNQIKDTLNVNNYYGYPSLLLNSDFYWNTGVATPITQADGNGAFFSEKWQVQGAGVANYTLTQTSFTANDANQIGSTTYIRVQISSYSSGDFYLYQRQTGSQFLRRYQARSIPFSILAYNSLTTTVKVQLELFIFYDPTSVTKLQGALFLDPGLNEIASIINTEFISPTAVGAGAYVEFRLRFLDLFGGTADFQLIYLKAELNDRPTVLYVDHALERSRIDNS